MQPTARAVTEENSMSLTPVGMESVTTSGGAFAALSEEARSVRQNSAVAGEGDAVDISGRYLLSDEEAEATLAQVMSDVPDRPGEALSVHAGLDYSRVMSLLEPVL